MLKKWAANNKDTLMELPPSDLNDREEVGFIGMKWNVKPDSFSFPTVEFRSAEGITRRELLSEIALVYDPLGWAQPLIVTAKMLMQTIWKTTIKWDEKIQPCLTEEWMSIREDLLKLPTISNPQWAICDKSGPVEIHGISDASAKAHGYCIYVSSVATSNASICRLILDKSRVTPMKLMCMAQLELKAAHLLAEMIAKLRKTWATASKVFGWVDSQVALYWITSQAEK